MRSTDHTDGPVDVGDAGDAGDAGDGSAPATTGVDDRQPPNIAARMRNGASH
jgi:hypothetical protein